MSYQQLPSVAQPDPEMSQRICATEPTRTLESVSPGVDNRHQCLPAGIMPMDTRERKDRPILLSVSRETEDEGREGHKLTVH